MRRSIGVMVVCKKCCSGEMVVVDVVVMVVMVGSSTGR